MQPMVDSTDIVETIAPNTGIAIPKNSPIDSSEDIQRERLVSRIKGEIERLQAGPQTDEIREAIGQLQSLSVQVNRLQVSLNSALATFNQVQSKAESEQRQAFAQEALDTLKSLSYADSVERYYHELSLTSRMHVDAIDDLMRKHLWTHKDEISFIKHSMPPSGKGDAFDSEIASAAHKMGGKEILAEIHNMSSDDVHAASVLMHHSRERKDAALAGIEDPAIQKIMRRAKHACPNTPEGAEAFEVACGGSIQDAQVFADKSVQQFCTKHNSKFGKYKTEVCASVVEKKALSEMSTEEAYLRFSECDANPDRKAALDSYLAGKTEGVNADTIKDVAAYKAMMSVMALEALEETRAQAIKISQQRSTELGKAQSKDNAYQDRGGEYESEALAKQLHEKYPKMSEEAIRNVSRGVVKQVRDEYPNREDLAKADTQKIKQMAVAATTGIGQDMWDNFLTTDKKRIAEVAQKAADEAKAQAAKEGKNKIEQDQAAVDAKKWVKVGGELGALGGHLLHLEGGKAMEVAGTLATKAKNGVSSWIDSATEAVGIKTYDNQIAKHMAVINNSAALTAVTNGNGEKIFDKDKSGKISQAEMTAMLKKHGFKDFDSLDKDKSGEVDKKEMDAAIQKIVREERAKGTAAKIEAVAKQHIDKDFAQDLKKSGITFTKEEIKALDANGDGKLDINDKDKIIAAMKKKGIDLNSYDKNHDGVDIKDFADAMHAAAATPAAAKKPQQAAKSH